MAPSPGAILSPPGLALYVGLILFTVDHLVFGSLGSQPVEFENLSILEGFEM